MNLTPEQLQQATDAAQKTLVFAVRELPGPGLALTGLLSAYATLAFNAEAANRRGCAAMLHELAKRLEAHQDFAPTQAMQHPMPSTVQ